MSQKDRERRIMAFINACPLRRETYAKHGQLYFEAVSWVAEEGEEATS